MKEYLTPDVVANSVRMRRSADPRTVVLVEGHTDAIFFEALFDIEACVVQSVRDRDSTVIVARILRADCFPGHVAIIDADFRRLTDSLENDPNILHTDGHDLEMMLLNSEALAKVIREIGTPEKEEAFARSRGPVVQCEVIKIAAVLGAMRFLNESESLKLRFEKLRFSRFVNHRTGELSISDAAEEVLRKTATSPMPLETIIEKTEDVLSRGYDLWELVCGHDAISVLSVLFRRLLGTCDQKSCTCEVLERSLRLAYGRDDFVQTSLFQLIREWEDQHQPWRILTSV